MIFVLITFGIFLLSPANTVREYPPGHWDRIIENQTFTSTLDLDTGDDNTLIIGSKFYNIEGRAIAIRNVSNIYIKDCTIYDIDGVGIGLRSSGSTQNVTIDNCTIYNTFNSGIHAAQRSETGVDHVNLTIKNNTIYNVGNDGSGHGIYVQSSDSLIENNTIYSIEGDGISIRSSGIIRGNTIWNTGKSCIRYFNDHLPGPSDALFIENNICYLSGIATRVSPGISLLQSPDVPLEWLLQNYYIRFNTMVSSVETQYGFKVESPGFDDKHVEVYGNIIVNTKDISKTLNPQFIDYLSSNYTSTSLGGFVNSTKLPYDFHLTFFSPARNYAAIEPDYPLTDIDQDRRTTNHLDAGADQYARNNILTILNDLFNETLWIKYTIGIIGGGGIIMLLILAMKKSET